MDNIYQSIMWKNFFEELFWIVSLHTRFGWLFSLTEWSFSRSWLLYLFIDLKADENDYRLNKIILC